MDLTGLVVESIEVVPAGSLDSAVYGHGMPELAASSDPCGSGGISFFLNPLSDAGIDVVICSIL